VQQSSSTIGAIAGALARAQTELTNPDKSLTAHLQTSHRPNGGDKSFRYAPLSAGLEIVRKCLGKNEIALTQTTLIDKEGGVVRLMTMLAHTSGEWISSDWPVCLIADVASPQRMGAALTYARRYSLFSLVGIAGEGDLDAPDLNEPSPAPSDMGPHSARYGSRAPAASGRAFAGRAIQPPTIAPGQSTLLRDRAITDLRELTSADELLAWALKMMPTKNALQADDASEVERAFSAKMATLTQPEQRVQASSDAGPTSAMLKHALVLRQRKLGKKDIKPKDSKGRSGIDKSKLTIATLKRHRNKAHLRFVASQPCLVCAREPSDAHHLRYAQPRGIGLKVSDEFTVPLCRSHHSEVHRLSNEREWWGKMNIDPLRIAIQLWQRSTK
jgi:hypothetical protein